ncbi:MAG: Acg family FMN-binding oxidoreductase [Bacteroidota bacterium]
MVLSTSLFHSCAPLKREHFMPANEQATQLQQLLYYASLAGSSHNTQPWMVQIIDKEHFCLFADTTRTLGVVDPHHRELFMSLGAFLENLTVAAEAYGYKAHITFGEDLSVTKKIASVYLEKSIDPTKQKRKFLLNQLEDRCTLRGRFSTSPITAKDSKYLVRDTQGTQLFSNNTEMGKFIGTNTLKAYRQQNFKEAVQEELAQWVRFSNKSVRQHRDGLTTAGMGITGMVGRVMQLFFTPKSVKGKAFVNKGIEKTAEQVAHCGGWLVISTSGDEPADWIEAGRIYERINLHCRTLHIGMHPMNQLIEEENFKTEAQAKLPAGAYIQFVARVGYVPHYPQPVSVRRPVTNFCQPFRKEGNEVTGS